MEQVNPLVQHSGAETKMDDLIHRRDAKDAEKLQPKIEDGG